jgi:hypothetical protein
MGQGMDIEDLCEFFLERREFGEHVFGTQTAGARWPGRRVQRDDLRDVGELIEERVDTHVQSSLGRFSLQQVTQRQRQHAVEGMDAQLLIGPMKGGREADPVGVFHLPERIFDVKLRSATEDNFLRGPIGVVRTEDALAQSSVFQCLEGGWVRPKAEGQVAVGIREEFRFENFGDVLAGGGFAQPLLEREAGIPFAACAGLLAAAELGAQFAQGRPLLAQGDGNAGKLAVQQGLAAGDDHGPWSPPDFFGCAMGKHALQAALGKRLETVEGYLEQVGMVGKSQRGNEVVGAGVQFPDIGIGGVAAVKDQRDMLTMLAELAEASDESVGDGGEHGAIVLIAGINMGKQGHGEIGADQQRQPNNPQIGAFAFGVAPLSKPGVGWRVDKGVEVGGIEDQRAQIDVKAPNQFGGDRFFDGGDFLCVQVAHVIPETLRAQGLLGGGKEAMENALVVPIIQGGLAAGRDTAIQRRQQQVLTPGESLIAFTDLLIDDRDHVEFMGHVPQGGDGPELQDFAFERFADSFLESTQKPFGGAEVHEHDGAGLAVDTAGFNDLPVRVSTAGLFLNSGHLESVYTIAGPWVSIGKAEIFSGKNEARPSVFQPCLQAVIGKPPQRPWDASAGLRAGITSAYSVYTDEAQTVSTCSGRKSALFQGKSDIPERARRQ